MIKYSTIAIATALAAGFAAPAAFAQGKEPVKIGVPTALSGAYAVLVPEVKRSIEFAINQANAKGGVDGRKVEYRMLDSELKPDMARKQAEKLALDGYNILTGTISSGEILAIGPMLERWDAILVSTFAKSTKITGDSCSPRLFRVNQNDIQDLAILKPWLQTRKEKKWAVLGADMAWGREIGKNFKEVATADGREVLGEYYPQLGSNDYAPFILQIRAAAPEAVFVALSGRDSINFLTQAKQLGLLEKTVIGGISITLDSNVKAVGLGMKGVWGNFNYNAEIDTPQNKQFVADWKKMYNGDEPTDLEGENYVGMQVILQAVERAHSVKPADLAKVINGGTFDTVFGKLQIRGSDNQMILPNYFGRIDEKDGKPHKVIALTLQPDQATPPADDSCKMGKL